MKKINILLLLGMVSLSVSCYANVTEKKNQRVWSNMPAYTQVFENQNELGLTSDVYDGIWEGEVAPLLPRVANPSPPDFVNAPPKLRIAICFFIQRFNR